MNLGSFFNGMNAVGVARKTETERLQDKERLQGMEDQKLQADIRQSEALSGQYDATASNMMSDQKSREAMDPIKIATADMTLKQLKFTMAADQTKIENEALAQLVLNNRASGVELTDNDERIAKANKNREALYGAMGMPYAPFSVATYGKRAATDEDIQKMVPIYKSTILTYTLENGGMVPDRAKQEFIKRQAAIGVIMSPEQINALDEYTNYAFTSQLPTIMDDVMKQVNDPNNFIHAVSDKTGKIDDGTVEAIVNQFKTKYSKTLLPSDLNAVLETARAVLAKKSTLTQDQLNQFSMDYMKFLETKRQANINADLSREGMRSQEHMSDEQVAAQRYGARRGGGGGGGGGFGNLPKPLANLAPGGYQSVLNTMAGILEKEQGRAAPRLISELDVLAKSYAATQKDGRVIDDTYVGRITGAVKTVLGNGALTLTGKLDPSTTFGDVTLGRIVSKSMTNAMEMDRKYGQDPNATGSYYQLQRDAWNNSGYIGKILSPAERIAKKRKSPPKGGAASKKTTNMK